MAVTNNKAATKIDDRVVRVDAVQKARGEAKYVCSPPVSEERGDSVCK